jgi:hypothetical protein
MNLRHGEVWLVDMGNDGVRLPHWEITVKLSA